MKAMIFAAGLGTRLKPMTNSLPKALLPIASKPLIYYIVQKLKALSYTHLVINLHHFSEQIRAYFEQNDNFGIDISFSDESQFLRETGGGLYYAKDLLAEPKGSFLLHNTDIFSNVDLKAFREAMPKNALAFLLVAKRKTNRYLIFDKTKRLKGWCNLASGQIRSPYPDLDLSEHELFAFSGIHNISTDIFEVLNKKNYPERFSIIDFYIDNCHQYPIYAHDSTGADFVDVGKLETLQEAEAFVQRYGL